jgi:hypothetical protein
VIDMLLIHVQVVAVYRGVQQKITWTQVKACGGSCRKNGARVRENERGYIAAWVWANIRKTVNSVATHLGIVDPVVPISGARKRLGAAHSRLRSGVRCASLYNN